MRVDCAGCAGCCIDWRSLAPGDDPEHTGVQRPLDDVYNLVTLTREDVRALLDAGLADATTPRLWEADDGPAVDIDGHRIAAIDGRPVFYLGLRKVAKPVGPFETDLQWLTTCVFLDPETLQCRIHGDATYPETCATYPGHNLVLGAETECERVEDRVGGERLLDDTPPEDHDDLLFGLEALGEKVFVYPDVDDLSGVVERAAAGRLTDADRAKFAAAAAAGAPGTTEVDPTHYDEALEQARAADSWAGTAVEEWPTLAASEPPDPSLAERVEEDHGAPSTAGWNA